MAAETGSKAGPQRESITDAGKSQKSGPVFNFIKIMKEQGELESAIRTWQGILSRIDLFFYPFQDCQKVSNFEKSLSFFGEFLRFKKNILYLRKKQ